MEKPAALPAAGLAPRDDRWQLRLLPLMVWVVVLLAVFFFAISLGQLSYLHWQLSQPHQSEVPASVVPFLADGEGLASSVVSAQLGLAALLESEAMIRRYEMASVVLMAQIWIRYLGFVTGMVIAVIGAVFILGKLRDSAVSEFAAEAQGMKVALTSASPGLVLATLGAVLMIVTVLARQEMNVDDIALYEPFAGASSGGARSEPLPERPSPADVKAEGGLVQ